MHTAPDSYPRTRGNELAPLDSGAALNWLEIATKDELDWFYSSDTTAPDPVKEWAGMQVLAANQFISMNDEKHMSFTEIADEVKNLYLA